MNQRICSLCERIHNHSVHGVQYALSGKLNLLVYILLDVDFEAQL
jgi:hypothetical protein